MIKKNTKAIFVDGAYEGDYDWKGGVPLCKGDVVTMHLNDQSLKYEVVKKEVSLKVQGHDQEVDVVYTFKIL